MDVVLPYLMHYATDQQKQRWLPGAARGELMTAIAMVVGMLPMSFSNTQNAALGRAVIGGLTVATVTTLLFVPCVFAILHGGKPGKAPASPQEAPA